MTFDLCDMTLTLYVSDGDGSTSCRSLADLVSFLVVIIDSCKRSLLCYIQDIGWFCDDTSCMNDFGVKKYLLAAFVMILPA